MICRRTRRLISSPRPRRCIAVWRSSANAPNKATDTPVTFQGAGFQYADGLNRPTSGVNDGNGFLFISHVGDIQPSGFLPITAGNVRTDDVVDIYRHSQLFTDLRYSRQNQRTLRYLRISRCVRRSTRTRLWHHRRLFGKRSCLRIGKW